VLSETTLFLRLITTICALWFTIAVFCVSDAIAIGACPLTLGIATASFLIVGEISFKATFLFTLITSVLALNFTTALISFLIAETVITGQVSSWVAATFFMIIISMTTPATLVSDLIRFIITLWLAVAVI
jgi:hypothetical protein